MLSNQSIFAAAALAEQYDAENIVLAPLAGWPLHHLVAASNISPEMSQKCDDNTVYINTGCIEAATQAKTGVFDKSTHTYAMDDWIETGTKAVQAGLTIARTGAAPRIAELIELVTMRMSNAPVSDLTSVYITEEEDCPAVYGPAFRKLVDQFANYHNGEPLLNINGPDLSTPEILEMVQTGVASIDAELVPWAVGLNENVVQDVYRSFFTIKNGADQRGFYGRMDKSAIRMVLVYCIAKHLVDNDTVFEGSTGSLKVYRENLEAILAQAAHLLTIQMDKNDSAIKNGNMVRSVAGNEVRVFSPVYRAWLESGGDNDILFGMSVSGNQQFTVGAITDRTEEYLRAWRSYVGVATSRDSSQRFNYIRQQLTLSYESILNKPNEDGVVADPIAIKNEMDCFREHLRSITIAEIDDLNSVARKLVCRTSFADSPAELILTRMDEEGKRNPKLSPREAAALATLWYVASWVASQIVAVSANNAPEL